MICLGIDTSTGFARVAVTENGDVRSACSSAGKKTHSETLLVEIGNAVDRAGVPLTSVGLFAVGLGPGAWTGLRVGITTAKALAYSLGVPIVGIPTLDAIAAGVTGYAGKLAVIVDARRHEVYGSCFEVDGKGGIRREGGVFVATPGNLDRVVSRDYALVGNGTALLPEEDRKNRRVFAGEGAEVEGGAICRLAVERFGRDGADDPRDIVPIYVRKSDAEIAREKKEAGR